MQYFKHDGRIFGYTPAPNRFRKMYNEIEKNQTHSINWDEFNKLDSINRPEYFNEKLKEINEKIKNEYQDFEEIRFIHSFFVVELNNKMKHDWVLYGYLKENTTLYKALLKYLPSQNPPETPIFWLYPPEERSKVKNEYSEYLKEYENSYKNF